MAADDLAVGWYLTVTVYVAIRGAFDIRQMLARLESEQSRSELNYIPNQWCRMEPILTKNPWSPPGPIPE